MGGLSIGVAGCQRAEAGLKRRFPSDSFGREAEFCEGGRDVLTGRDGEVFFFELFGVGGKTVLREVGVCDVPTRPGACGAQCGARLDHPGGEMLVVAAGVADESFIGLALHDPRDRSVGQRVPGCRVEIGAESAVYQEQRLRGTSLEPERLRAFEGAEIEFVTAFARLSEGAHSAGRSEAFRRRWKVRTVGEPRCRINVVTHPRP